MNILIVDDEPDMIFFLKNLLAQREGFLVSTAASGNEAMAVLCRTTIDILISDVRMPGMDGIELVKQATALVPDLQCIVLTGHGDIENAIEAMRAGAINYLQKPINFEELLLAIKIGAEKRELLQANRQYQQALEAARDAAEAGNRAKTEFLANISHEMRTPMNGILGFTDLLLQENLTPSQTNQLLTVRECALRLYRHLDNIIDFVKLETDSLTLDKQPFAVAELLSSVLVLLRSAAEEKGLSLTWRIDSEVSPTLIGDGRRFCLVVEELVKNAVKFSANGSIRVTVAVESRQTVQEVLRIDVTDQGPGISPADQQRLFQAFVQVDGSSTRPQAGTGLGLALCRKLVQLMGGRIWVESAPGQGSTFSFTACFTASQATAEVHSPEATGGSGPASWKILVVDDTQFNLDLVKAMFERGGHTVIAAENGLEALRTLAKMDVDFVAMDVQMPVMDGITATQLIRQCEAGIVPEGGEYADLLRELTAKRQGSHLPIIALTGHAEPHECLRAGMDAFLGKPFKRATALQIMGHLLGGGEMSMPLT